MNVIHNLPLQEIIDSERGVVVFDEIAKLTLSTYCFILSGISSTPKLDSVAVFFVLPKKELEILKKSLF